MSEGAREWSKRVKRAEQSVALQSAAERVSEVPSMISSIFNFSRPLLAVNNLAEILLVTGSKTF